jgi:hypothetical protein
MGKWIIAIGIIGGGALWYAQFQADAGRKNMSLCLEFVGRFERAYRAEPPVSGTGPSALRSTVPLARKACNERRFGVAITHINNAEMTCRANRGCDGYEPRWQ